MDQTTIRIGLAATFGLCAADRGFLAIHRDHYHAGFRARHGRCFGADAPYACCDADSAIAGLCAHGPRQGATRKGRCLETRAEECSDPGGDLGRD